MSYEPAREIIVKTGVLHSITLKAQPILERKMSPGLVALVKKLLELETRASAPDEELFNPEDISMNSPQRMWYRAKLWIQVQRAERAVLHRIRREVLNEHASVKSSD